jgi:hypothetical protein
VANVLANVTSAEATALTMMPASRISLPVIEPVDRASEYTSIVAASPPASAASGKIMAPKTVSDESPARIAIVAPRAAPPDTPSRYGSANGLRSMVCRAAPATDSPAPAMAASATRGRRAFITMA